MVHQTASRVATKQLKSKGLQKLRWYCQLCEKQCRDENGFKCHCASDAHLRRVQLFGENPKRAIDEYSETFEQNFLKHLQLSHRHARIEATKVYNEVISHKSHVHMNATKWTTLTEFIKHLGNRPDCTIEETAKGWFILYEPIDKEDTVRQHMQCKRARENTDEREIEKIIKLQASRCKGSVPSENVHFPTEMKEGIGSFDLKKAQVKSNHLDTRQPQSLQKLDYQAMNKRDAIQRDRTTDDMWVLPGLVVKHKELRKGVILAVKAHYVANVSFTDKIVDVKQADLEPVIPKLRSKVVVTKGRLRGRQAQLLGIEPHMARATLLTDDGVNLAVHVHDICKVKE